MHDAVRQWVGKVHSSFGPFGTVVEFGGRNINGTIRDMFGPCAYTAVDIAEGPGVEVVADCATWQSPAFVDCVVCTEVLEHTPVWRDIVTNAANQLRGGGVFIMTCAGPGRGVHGAAGGGLEDGEFYENVHPDELDEVLAESFGTWQIDVAGNDVRCWAVR